MIRIAKYNEDGERMRPTSGKTTWSGKEFKALTRALKRLKEDQEVDKKLHIKGVDWSAAKGKWQARVQIKGKRYHLGFYNKYEKAANAKFQFLQDNGNP